MATTKKKTTHRKHRFRFIFLQIATPHRKMIKSISCSCFVIIINTGINNVCVSTVCVCERERHELFNCVPVCVCPCVRVLTNPLGERENNWSFSQACIWSIVLRGGTGGVVSQTHTHTAESQNPILEVAGGKGYRSLSLSLIGCYSYFTLWFSHISPALPRSSLFSSISASNTQCQIEIV